jgi:hypothetical protein
MSLAWERWQINKTFCWKSLNCKRSLGRPRHRREDNIRMDIREIGWEGITASCENVNELSGSIKGGKFLYHLSDCWFLEKDCAACC